MTKKDNTPAGPDLFFMANACSRAVLDGIPLDTWLDEMDARMDTVFPPPPEGELRRDPDLRRRLMRVMLRAIWLGMPQPALDYALPNLPSPARNEPCHCGSAKKYKLCCQPIERDLPDLRVNFLPSLLDVLPRKHWPELAGSRIDTGMVDHAVEQWLDHQDFKAVLALLEPWFAEDSAYVAKHEFLFDALLDAYSELGNPRKKASLIDRARRVGDRAIRSAAMQRQISILADRGAFDEAWNLFRRAQKNDPESPNLSHLEVTTLIVEGREDEARTRADFWARRLARRNDPDLAGLVEHLRGVARRGSIVLGERMAEATGTGELPAAVRNAPPPTVLYTLDPHHGDAGPLTPKRKLARALRSWREQINQVDYFPGASRERANPAETIKRMLVLLEEQPELWSSFEALTDLAYTARSLDFDALRDGFILPILERAGELLDRVIKANKAEDCLLEWGHWANRPALDLLAWQVSLELNHPATPAHIARLERLLKLNPNDNQGMRMPLARRYLETGGFEAVLALSDRYPDDLPEMRYNRVLALFALKRSEQAGEELDRLARQYPKILDALLKARARRPRINPSGILLGGDDEAWLYRAEYREIWQKLGALKWARQRAQASRAGK